MAIIGFQLFIFLSIIFVSFVKRGAVKFFCILWTVFTLFAVLTSPLLLLQLVTIWWTYSWLGGDSDSEKAVRVARSPIGPRESQKPMPPPHATPMLASAASVGNKVSQVTAGLVRSLEEANNFVRRQQEVEKVTAALASSIAEERGVLETAIEFAKLEASIADMLTDDTLREHYQKEMDAFQQLRAGASGDHCESLRCPPRPDFSLPARHPDAASADAIAHKIGLMRNEHDQFLTDVARQMDTDSNLFAAVGKQVLQRGGTDVWQTVCAKMRNQSRQIALIKAPATGSETSPRNHMSVAEGLQQGLSEAREKALIRQKAEALDIPHLLHFTRVQNLHNIMIYGLNSVTALQQRDIEFHRNDELRLDGHPNFISLSIAHPNDKMFFKYRRREPLQNWVVLVVDRSVLWSTRAAFCKHNAADNRVSKIPIADRMTAHAFCEMFGSDDMGPSREAQSLKPCDPTDVQAEVLVFDKVPVEAITSVVFMKSSGLMRSRLVLANREATLQGEGQGFFGTRSYVRSSSGKV